MDVQLLAGGPVAHRGTDDLLPVAQVVEHAGVGGRGGAVLDRGADQHQDRKSTRLNSSHVAISYAVFCLKKKTIIHILLFLLRFSIIILLIGVIYSFVICF